MKKAINETTRTVTFTFEGLEPIVFNPADASEANRDYAMLHGFAQRIGDAAAISKTKENGFVVTEEMRRAEVLAMVGHYASGSTDWNVRPAGGRGRALNPQIAALAQKMGKTYAEAEAWFNERLMAELMGEGA